MNWNDQPNHHLIISFIISFFHFFAKAVITNNTSGCHQHQHSNNPAKTNTTTNPATPPCPEGCFHLFLLPAQCHGMMCVSIKQIPTPAMLQLSVAMNTHFFKFALVWHAAWQHQAKHPIKPSMLWHNVKNCCQHVAHVAHLPALMPISPPWVDCCFNFLPLLH